MRQRIVVLTVSLCTCLLLAGPAWPAAPAIEEVRIGSVLTSGSDIVTRAESEISVLVSDADGAADVYSIRVGPREATASQSGPWDRVVEGPDRVRVTWERTYALDPGPVDVIVTDLSELQDALVVAVPPPPSQPPEISSPGPGYPVVSEPQPMLSWTNVEPGTTNSVTISRAVGPEVWSYEMGGATSVAYNTDGTALDPQLRPGFRYSWSFSSKLLVDDGVTDPRVHTYTVNDTQGYFIAYSDEPVVERVEITRERRAPLDRAAYYEQSFTVCATDVASGGDFAAITIAEPDGTTHSLMDPPALTYTDIDGRAVKGVLHLPPVATAPLPGRYTASADASGYLATLITPSAPAVPALAAESPPGDSVIEDTTPVFSWHSGLEDTVSYIVVYVPDHTSPNEWTAYYLSEEHSAYDPALAGHPELTAGQTYLWDVGSWTTFSGADYCAEITTATYATNRFTIYYPSAPRPELPGKLAYGIAFGEIGQGGIIGYDPDPHTINWLGSWRSAGPDWSPDGSALAYSGANGLTVDRLDGSEPVRLGVMSHCARWSPDGTEFAWSGWLAYDLIGLSVVGVDGSDVQVLADEYRRNGRPEWSPDGAWIAYCQSPGQDWQRLWLMRPDGSDKHPVIPTELVGYPGYQITIGGFGHSWAPDAQRLVTNFVAEAEGQPEVWGLGTISMDGGAMTPIFTTTEAVCCASPQFPIWSPEGTQVVFTSAHHLPLDPGWADGKYELGSELWMINATGSGEPQRLTYDCVVSGGPRMTPSWWAPLRFADIPKSQWAYCAINACAQAGIVAGYGDGLYHPEIAVTRDQMAVYISRGLAGGDENVPEFADTPTFPDVGSEHWALGYIEYAVEQNVVEGYGNGLYHPEYEVTRDQMAVYVARALVAPTGEAALADYVPADPRDFPDVPDTFWAYTHVEYCVENGVVAGYLDELYHPEIVVTRDQMAVYIARAFELL